MTEIKFCQNCGIPEPLFGPSSYCGYTATQMGVAITGYIGIDPSYDWAEMLMNMELAKLEKDSEWMYENWLRGRR